MAINHGLYLGMNAKPWQDIFTASATKQHELGAFFDDEFGRRFRYALNGAGALVAGNIVQGATLGGAATTLQSACTVNTAAAAGDTRILVTAATTAQAAGLYDEGWASIWDNDLTAVYTRRIKTSGALTTTGATDTASCVDLYEGCPVALTTSDKISLQVNIYKNIIVQPAGRIPTGIPVGGVHCGVTAAYYAWVQTRGLFGFRLKDVTTNIGAGAVGPAGTTAGSLITAVEADTAAAYTPVIGWSTALWLDEYSGIVMLMCE